jgi:hypothetical protein
MICDLLKLAQVERRPKTTLPASPTHEDNSIKGDDIARHKTLLLLVKTSPE